ncbi:molecular chaperone DnaK [Frankia sp. CcI49]|uniref:Hsp70 family protein n=1 Tax=Frankia sp. CcI49 TaxID=1745382 RepID=UPI000976FB91|nr:Hsp70 family protein [Frankia sp. CcI49]ONH62089.1 molecular chaperone DnaK [Frankia sp. CcI49]
MGYQLGIDVGSANTVLAVSDGGWPAVLTLGGGRAVPSVLYMPQAGGMLVGRSAARRATADPERAARGFLHRVGEPGHVLVAGAAYSPEGLLGRLVGHLVGQVVAARGEEPEQIVVSHPTFWPEHRRAAFAEAVSQLSDVSAPVTTCASADAIGTLLISRRAARTVDLVGFYDFGAGHFDSAVLSFSPFGFERLGSPVGVGRAGGAEFDELLVDRALARVGTSRDRLDLGDPAIAVALGRLRDECTQAKEYLAEEEEIEVTVSLPGRETASVTVSRSDLETLVAPVVDDTVRAFRQALRSGQAEPADLSTVLLFGGTARMPLVAAQMRAAFPGVGRWQVGSDDDIATGAALIAAGLAERSPGEQITSIIRPPVAGTQPGSVPPWGSFSQPGSYPAEGSVPPASSFPPAGSVPPVSSFPPVGSLPPAGSLPPVGSTSSAGPVPPARPADPDATVIGGRTGAPVSSPPPAGTAPGTPMTYPTATGASPSSSGFDEGAATMLGGMEIVNAAGESRPGGAAPVPPQAARPDTRHGGRGGRSGSGGGPFAGRSGGTIAAAVAAIVFVTAGVVFGVALTGGDDEEPTAVVPIATAVTTPPAQQSASPAPLTRGPKTVLIAGSAEVAPISETAYAGFRQVQPNVTVNVSSSTTEDGFAKLCAGEIDVADASFEFDSKANPGCADQIVGFEVAHHTLPIVVNPQNSWARCMTLDQVREIWNAGSQITRWDQIDSSFPAQPITFVGPPRDSVQAQVFNATVNDASNRSRQYQEADLSGVATDVARDQYALGFLDFPTFQTFGSQLRGLEIDNGKGCVEPNAVTAGTGFYLPLCKPVFVYARKDSLRESGAAAFMRYYMQNGEKIAFDAHYVPRAQSTIDENVAKVDELIKGVPPVTA